MAVHASMGREGRQSSWLAGGEPRDVELRPLVAHNGSWPCPVDQWQGAANEIPTFLFYCNIFSPPSETFCVLEHFFFLFLFFFFWIHFHWPYPLKRRVRMVSHVTASPPMTALALNPCLTGAWALSSAHNGCQSPTRHKTTRKKMQIIAKPIARRISQMTPSNRTGLNQTINRNKSLKKSMKMMPSNPTRMTTSRPINVLNERNKAPTCNSGYDITSNRYQLRKNPIKFEIPIQVWIKQKKKKKEREREKERNAVVGPTPSTSAGATERR